ncbi:MAG: phosphatase PAP2 family protein [Pseudomonadota bacterium]
MTMQVNVSTRGSAIGPALWRNRALIALVSLHFLAVYAICLMLGHEFGSGTASTLINLLQLQVPLFLIILFFWRFGWMVIKVRPRRPIQWFLNDLKEIVLDRHRIFCGAVAFVTMCLFAGTFTVAKDLIPVIHPFAWDETFAVWDRVLHFGQDPWRLIWPLTGSPYVTTAINAAYHLWLMLAYFLIFVACFNVSRHDKHRTYLLADVTCWIVGGNILATIFSSVGPVYYQAMGYGTDFRPLMDQLYAFNEVSPVWALPLQEMLIDGYLNDGPVKGISAMPSMHVASTVMMTLYAFSVSRVWGWIMTVFAALILVGSVQLGWHYAIDGYVSIVLALGIYWVARRVIEALSRAEANA